MIAYATKSIKHFWALHTLKSVTSNSAPGEPPSDLVRENKAHRLTAICSAAICILYLPWVAYIASIVSETGRRVPLLALILMAIYAIGLNVAGRLGFKIIDEM
ncbi:hypothetical protein [Nocardia salmonicida]|uniref:hypothetical protein n=1 Tax=Nocardia salmonicida TaxID=53431 RepID=UPI0012F4BB8D|nr:hypothetical protein [Nocardia salmonicida]